MEGLVARKGEESLSLSVSPEAAWSGFAWRTAREMRRAVSLKLFLVH
jgi:hypothetical protein